MSKDKKKYRKHKPQAIAVAVILLVSTIGIYCFDIPVPFIYQPFMPASNLATDVSVQLIDVQQGDSILIRDHEKNVLIDAGENDQGTTVVRYLHDQNIEELDLVIGTHPHSDHIGGLDTVMENIKVSKLLLPSLPNNLVPTTKTYLDVLHAAEETGVEITTAQPGNNYPLSQGNLEILGPIATYDELNSCSIISRFSYQNTSFLFTGDMEKDAEKDLIETGVDLHATVLKLGHHGSNTSSTKDFLQAVNASFYAICVGKENSYGHPSQKVLDRLGDAPVYRTDADGSVVFYTDGNTLEVQTEK